MKLIVKQGFSWAHDHVRVLSYAEGEEIETDDPDLINVATTEGWVEQCGEAEGQPLAETTAPPAETTAPLAETTAPPAETTAPPAETTAPPAEAPAQVKSVTTRAPKNKS